MRPVFIIFLLIVTSFTSNSQAPSWIWGASGDNSGSAAIMSAAEDSAGNTYVVGKFTGTISFDTAIFTAAALNASNVFLVKYNTVGRILWARAITGASLINSYSLVTDRNGDVYVAGIFRDVAYFESATITSLGDQDIFLAKYTSAGALSWVRSYGTTQIDVFSKGLAIDSKHNVIIAGGFNNTSAIQFGSYSFSSVGFQDIFLVKIDSSGQVVWAKRFGEANTSQVSNSLTVDKTDNIYLIGGFEYQINLDSIQVKSISSGFVAADIFVAKFDSGGNAKWAVPIGGRNPTGGTSGGSASGNCVRTDTAGNLIVGGGFVNCDIVIRGAAYLPPYSYISGTGDIWLAKFNSLGSCIWSKSAKGQGNDALYDLATDAECNVYTTGHYTAQCIFDGDTAFYPVGKSNMPNMFVAKYDPNGVERWLTTAGDVAVSPTGFSILVNKSEGLTVTGDFVGPDLLLGKILVSNGSSSNGFIAKLGKATGLENNELSVDDGCSTYPIPASNRLHILLHDGAFESFKLLTAEGQCLLSGDLKWKKSESIALPVLADGVYYLQLSGRTRVVLKKIIIEQNK